MNPERRVGLEWLNIFITGITFVAIVGGWLWWGGRFSQRMDTVEAQQKAQGDAIEQLRNIDNKQSSDIAVVQSQYQTILNQLTAINSKLDGQLVRR